MLPHSRHQLQTSDLRVWECCTELLLIRRHPPNTYTYTALVKPEIKSNAHLLLEVQHFDHIFMSHFFKMECLIAGASRRHQGIRLVPV